MDYKKGKNNNLGVCEILCGQTGLVFYCDVSPDTISSQFTHDNVRNRIMPVCFNAKDFKNPFEYNCC